MKNDPVHDRTRCTARTRSGRGCKNPPILGGTVCRMHGGSAPAVRAAANRRLLAMVLPALARLDAIVRKPETSDADRIRAIVEVLNRTGFSGKTEIELTVAPWQAIIEDIVMDVPDGWESPTPAFERDEDFKEPAIESGEIVDAEIIDEPVAAPAPAPHPVGSGSLVPPAHIRERLPDAARSNVEWRR